MKLNNHGTTRVVFIIGDYVYKIPKFWRWTNFLRGLLANINEGQTWRWNTGKYYHKRSQLLCPVVWTMWGGWLLIMRRAEPITQDSFDNLVKWHALVHIHHFPGDDTCKNYGLYNDQVVKVDYGDLDNAWGEDFKPKN